MILSVLSTIPVQGDNDITIDKNIVIEFNQSIDPFTVEKGVSLYYFDNEGEYAFVPYTFSISNNRLTLIPSSLVADTKHYLSILPGNDPTRYLSAQTVSEPIYTRVSTSTGTLKTTSSYSGSSNVTYNINIGPNNIADIGKGLAYLGTFDYSDGVIIGDSDLSFYLDGTFDIGDQISINCFKASGTDSIYKIDFSTTKYTTITPGSIELTTDDIDLYAEPQKLFIVDSIPEDLSVNNLKCNPIIIKFNKPISQEQDIISKVKIKKSSFLSSGKKEIDYEYTISDNILKIYLKSVGNPTL